MGRLSREAGGLGEYSDEARNDQPELEPDDGWPDLSELQTEPDEPEDEPA